MNALRPYLKAVAPALLTVTAVAVQWIVTGEYDRAELVTTITGLASATLTYFVRNEDTVRYEPLDLEPGVPAPEPAAEPSG